MSKRSRSDNFPARRQKTDSSALGYADHSTKATSSSPRLKVHPYSRYEQGPAVLRKPMFLGDFSLDEQRRFCHDQRNLSFIHMDWTGDKKVQFDLNVAMDKVIRKNGEETKNEKLDRMLEWILSNTAKFHTKESAGKSLQCLSTDFVCFRGLLTQLMCTPYENREGWIVCATRFRNTIYLCAYETPERKAQREGETEMQKTMCSWGYKFEQYMIDGSNTSEGVNENEEYCVMMRSRLHDHSLVYGAEVDGADPALYKTPHGDLGAFVELKTSKEVTSEREHRTLHKFKMMKWWGQSHLVGIPRVVCGFRDTSGIIHTLRTYHVQEIPKLAQDYWKSDNMLKFLRYFLDFVKRSVLMDDPQCIYKFERFPGGDITCTYLGHDPEWAFLPEWYYKKVFNS